MVNSLKVIIAAAGLGKRMKNTINKQYILLDARPIITYSLDILEESELVDEIVIVANAQETNYCETEIVQKHGYRKVNRVISGGEKRQDSVFNGLKSFRQKPDFIAVQDGARPFLTSGLLERIFEQALKWGAAIPAIAVNDTLKTVEDGFVDQTLDRTKIMAVQTPQIFAYEKLLNAYQKAYAEGFIGTDDASLYERYYRPVKIVKGEDRNIKITRSTDLLIAEAFLQNKNQSE